MDELKKRKQSFLLRLPISIREKAVEIAHEDGTSRIHLVAWAVAEKISRMTRPKEPLTNTPHLAPGWTFLPAVRCGYIGPAQAGELGANATYPSAFISHLLASRRIRFRFLPPFNCFIPTRLLPLHLSLVRE